MESDPESLAEELARFAAESLDWPAVRDTILAFATSALGRRALSELGPRDDAGASEALERVRELQARLAAGEEPPLAGTPDPLPALRAAQRFGRSLDGEVLVEVARLLRLVGDLGHWCAGRRTQVPVCAALFVRLPDLDPLRTELEDTLDGRGRVVDDATAVLGRLRAGIASVTRDLDRIVRAIAGRPALKGAFAEGQAGRVHQRAGRRVLAVRQQHAGRIPGIVHDRSQTGETVFVEPREAAELGNQLTTLSADAEREVSRILSELTRAVLGQRASLEVLSARLAEVELALIAARYARDVDGRPARLPGARGAAPRGGVLRAFRHPLLIQEERLGHIPAVVPLDLRLGGDFDLLVVTGPNTGGKTLALKAAGLAALMTRMGLAIPCAEGTTVPLHDGVVADIGDAQEIQQNLSTFSSHLVRIRAGLERAGPRTLVLLDELGGGTDPTEGAALGAAILESLLTRSVPTIASTHLGKLKEFAYCHDRAENGHVEFDLDSLAPRYTLVIGAPGESRALAIAQRLGLPTELVERAEALIEPVGGEAEQLMEEMRDVRVAAERLRAEAEERLVELELRLAETKHERERMSERREQVEAEAQRGLEERLARVRAWVERARALLPQVASGSRPALTHALDGLEEALGDAALTERRRAFIDGLKKGALIWLPRFKKRCEVARIHKGKRELEVLLGKRRLTVGFDDVTFYEAL